MRIVISAPRKSGGAHLRCLLSMAYDLKAPPVSAPGTVEPGMIATWIADLPEQSVSTCDLPYSDLAAPASAAAVHLMGVIRHPFDLFTSNYVVAQQQAARGRGRNDDEGNRAWSILSGEALDSEVTQQYAAADFGSEVRALLDWTRSGHAVRYEKLLADPAAEVSALAPSLGPLADGRIHQALSLCPPENVVLSRPDRGRRMPSLPPGAWRERLPSALVETLRARYGAEVTALGYDAS